MGVWIGNPAQLITDKCNVTSIMQIFTLFSRLVKSEARFQYALNHWAELQHSFQLFLRSI